MDLREVREKAKDMLAVFVNEIGLDGEYYASSSSCPMAWDNIVMRCWKVCCSWFTGFRKNNKQVKVE